MAIFKGRTASLLALCLCNLAFNPLLNVTISSTHAAEPVQPVQAAKAAQQAPANNSDILIAAATGPQLPDAIAQISALMRQAQRPGHSALIQQALMQFSALPSQPSADYWLLAADLAQQQHQFPQALAALKQAATLQQQPQIALMQARIALVQAKPLQALQYCKQLLSQQELFLFQLCSLEAAGRNGQAAQSYPLLQQMAKRGAIPTAERLYLQAVLAEQAEQLQSPMAAATHLQAWLAQAPVPMWLKWADLLMPSAPQQVFAKLAALAQQVTLEDSLLLRLARAEQQLQAGDDYFTQVAARIALRERRHDLLHSADLSYFYLYLQVNPAKARHYAGINYQQAKEPDDLKLALASGWTPAELAQLPKNVTAVLVAKWPKPLLISRQLNSQSQ